MRFAGHLPAVVALAATQVGYVERPGNRTKYGAWFGWDGVAWCAIFASWVFAHSGQQLPPLSNSKGVAYVPLIKQRAEATGQWRGAGYNPKPGDLCVFWFTSRPDHVEVVGGRGRLSDGRVHTFGGNTNYAGSRTGGMVVEALRRSNIHGFVAVDDVTPKGAAQTKPSTSPFTTGSTSPSKPTGDPDMVRFITSHADYGSRVVVISDDQGYREAGVTNSADANAFAAVMPSVQLSPKALQDLRAVHQATTANGRVR